jgi:hypothetical protein
VAATTLEKEEAGRGGRYRQEAKAISLFSITLVLLHTYVWILVFASFFLGRLFSLVFQQLRVLDFLRALPLLFC